MPRNGRKNVSLKGVWRLKGMSLEHNSLQLFEEKGLK